MTMTIDEQARRIWDVLVKRAPLLNSKIHYSNLAEEIDYQSARLSRPLGMIQTYCEEEGLAPLTILVIEKGTGCRVQALQRGTLPGSTLV